MDEKSTINYGNQTMTHEDCGNQTLHTPKPDMELRINSIHSLHQMGNVHHLPSGRCWIYTETVMKEAIADNRIWFWTRRKTVFPEFRLIYMQKNEG